jgi:hypothetical protein
MTHVSIATRLLALLLIPACLACPKDTGRSPTDPSSGWTEEARDAFYTEDQGSRVMPLAWYVALEQPNGQPFSEDSLSRYGYLANPNSVPAGLPVGFTVASAPGGEVLGITCAACHTRQIEVAGTPYRIDGGPAIADFPRFLGDLNSAVLDVLRKSDRFDEFAEKVLGASSSQPERDELRTAVAAWSLRFDTLVTRSLGAAPSELGRLDAVQMIFNRLTGLDIGAAPDHLIPENIKLATAPVRYPFLWNAAAQDMTQWPGFAYNGNDLFGLARNCGEVLGVFAEFHPKKDPGKLLLKIDYLAHNTTNFHGLRNLEKLIRKIPPPKWPWEVDMALAQQGKAIFERGEAQGGCGPGCHEAVEGEVRSLHHTTWKTPLQDVGTDSREYSVLATSVKTGLLEGAPIPFTLDTLKGEDTAFRVLRTVVLGSILQHYTNIGASMADEESAYPPETEDLKNAFQEPPPPMQDEASFKYEARVLEGIWATAPYLHNGSVPTLAELLKPASERVSSFAVGPEYDPVDIGLAKTQQKFGHMRQTTDCASRDSGNSRCGHEFGTQISPEEKRALLEYLKIL